MPSATSRSRRSSRVAASAMKPALIRSVLQRGRPLLKYVCPLFGFLLIIAYLASSLLDGGLEKNSYGVYTYEVVNEYNHDPKAFTQGLLYAENDTLYESTGMYGSSSVRRVHVQSGQVLQLQKMEGKYFGEGLTLLNHSLFQVAWRITSGFIYDANTLSPLGSFRHPMKDGWGLATNGKIIYGSDGTSTIYVMQSSTFKEERRFLVKDQDKEISQLNELEYIDGELWANIWLTDCIVRISPENGQVLGWILLHQLRSNLLAHGNKQLDVLNGIAWDQDQNRLFVTGKYWPKLYEIKVYPHSEDFRDRERVWKRCHVY